MLSTFVVCKIYKRTQDSSFNYALKQRAEMERMFMLENVHREMFFILISGSHIF